MSSDAELIQQAIKASGVHKKIVLECWPYGVIARCPLCGSTNYLDVEETTKCLGEGWPKCCGRSVTVTEAKSPQ
jgi:hypothetical protein